MEGESRQQQGRDDALSSLDAAINALGVARNEAGMEPAKDAFSSTRILLDTIRVGFLLPFAV